MTSRRLRTQAGFVHLSTCPLKTQAGFVQLALCAEQDRSTWPPEDDENDDDSGDEDDGDDDDDDDDDDDHDVQSKIGPLGFLGERSVNNC